MNNISFALIPILLCGSCICAAAGDTFTPGAYIREENSIVLYNNPYTYRGGFNEIHDDEAIISIVKSIFTPDRKIEISNGPLLVRDRKFYYLTGNGKVKRIGSSCAGYGDDDQDSLEFVNCEYFSGDVSGAPNDIISIYSTPLSAAAVRRDGSLVLWGEIVPKDKANFYIDGLPAIEIRPPARLVKATVGYRDGAALDENGDVWAFTFSQEYFSITGVTKMSGASGEWYAKVVGLPKIKELKGASIYFALASDGSVYQFGYWRHSTGSGDGYIGTPSKIAELSDIKAIEHYMNSAVFLSEKGDVYFMYQNPFPSDAGSAGVCSDQSKGALYKNNNYLFYCYNYSNRQSFILTPMKIISSKYISDISLSNNGSVVLWMKDAHGRISSFMPSGIKGNGNSCSEQITPEYTVTLETDCE